MDNKLNTSEIIKKVRKIEIKTRGLSNQIFSGHYHSAFKGKGMTFSEVREYQYGDDIRSIDWNVTARYNHPYVKIYEEEREMTVMLLIDVSASNLFGTKNRFKSELLTEIAATLSFSAIHNNDKVGVIFFSDKIEKYIPPKKGKKHILLIIRELLSFQPKSTQTNIAEGLRFFSNVIKKRATVFLLSDFMDTNYEKTLQIAKNKHDLIAVQLYDKQEETMPDMGLVRMLDSETRKEVWIDTSNPRIRKNMETNLNQRKTINERIFLSNGIDRVKIATDEDYVKQLLQLFKMRGARR